VLTGLAGELCSEAALEEGEGVASGLTGELRPEAAGGKGRKEVMLAVGIPEDLYRRIRAWSLHHGPTKVAAHTAPAHDGPRCREQCRTQHSPVGGLAAAIAAPCCHHAGRDLSWLRRPHATEIRTRNRCRAAHSRSDQGTIGSAPWDTETGALRHRRCWSSRRILMSPPAPKQRRCRRSPTTDILGGRGDVEEARSAWIAGVEEVPGSWDGEMREMREKT
jgi:hypothetical protein